MAPRRNSSSDDADNTFKILVASDIHLGYAESDKRRENDSFNSFEEILEMAKEEEVDFVLLGGDLFHDNKPTPSTLKRCMEIMKKHCLGSRPVNFEYLSNPKVDFKGLENPQVNYYSPDINVALPVFSIHGNHDDPIGNRKTSAVDHLAVAGLINYFGQVENLNEITVNPVLLRKGETLLALYGLGCIKDERLHRLFRDRKVVFSRESQQMDSWFNIFVLHQNRIKHGPTSYIPTTFFPSFLHYAVWGHEHECRIDPEEEVVGTYDIGKTEEDDLLNPHIYISQPGSSVATSLCPGEAVQKKVGVLYVNKKNFKLVPKRLKTVRPFVFEDLDTADVFPGDLPREPAQYLEKFLEAKVKQLRTDSAEQLTGHPKQPVEPLIRIRVFYDNEDVLFHEARFSQKFCDTVANSEIVMFKKKTVKRTSVGNLDVNDLDDFIMDEEAPDLEGHIEEILEIFFTSGREAKDKTKILEIHSEKGLSVAVKCCVDKTDKDTLTGMIQIQRDMVTEHLRKQSADKTVMLEALEKLREQRYSNVIADAEDSDLKKAFDNFRSKTAQREARDPNGSADVLVERNVSSDDEAMNSDGSDIQEISVPSRGRGRGRGSRGAKGVENRSTEATRGSVARGASAPRRRGRARGGF